MNPVDLVYRGVVEAEVALWGLGRPRADWLRLHVVSPVSRWFERRGGQIHIPEEDLAVVEIPSTGNYRPDGGPAEPGDTWLAVNTRTNQVVRVVVVEAAERPPADPAGELER